MGKTKESPAAGGCLLFAWGPPWVWLPSFERSRHHAGWSLIWLWCGLYYLPLPVDVLLLDGAYPRCPGCQRSLPIGESRVAEAKTGRTWCSSCWEDARA